ncbi:TonB-dependent receptor, partial [Acinetobacter baumannii]
LDLQFNRLAWTVGGNYEVRSNFALFARFAHGFRMPDVDQYQSLATFDASTADGQAAIRNFNDRPEVKPITTTMVEAGLRYSSRLVSTE